MMTVFEEEQGGQMSALEIVNRVDFTPRSDQFEQIQEAVL